MLNKINYAYITCWWTGALLLCASLTACTSDSTIQEEDVDDGSVPMQFSQAVMSAPVRRAASTNYLTQGFLVSCWKGFDSAKQQVVMDKYEVKYKTDPWANLSKWDYVGLCGFYCRGLPQNTDRAILG